MAPDPTPAAAGNAQSKTFSRLLGGMSIFTLLMTVPQVLTIWVGQQAAGVVERKDHAVEVVGKLLGVGVGTELPLGDPGPKHRGDQVVKVAQVCGLYQGCVWLPSGVYLYTPAHYRRYVDALHAAVALLY